MDLVVESLSTILAGLGLILMVIAAAAAARHRDVRLACVGAAQGLLATVGVLSLLNQVSPLYGGAFQVDAIPLGMAVVAAGLLYLALVRRPIETPARTDG